MGEYTILMKNATKQLVATNIIKLHQHENLCDVLTFLVEYDYFGQDLRDFSLVLNWLDPTGVAHVDILEQEEEIYKDRFQRYFLPITSPMNRYAGEIEMKLVFTKMDYENQKRYKLESDTIKIEISTIKDFYTVIPDESFSAIDDRIDELRALADIITEEAKKFDETKADNHRINEDGQLVLTAHGEDIGDPVDVATVEVPDGDDEFEDGILDLTGRYEDVIL